MPVPEFGIDKTGDVLDSAQAGRLFEDLYVEAIRDPDAVESTVETVVQRIRQEAEDARTGSAILGATDMPDPGEAPRLITHPLPHWVETMTVSYLHSHGGDAQRDGRCWRLTWPDGECWPDVVFTSREADSRPSARHATLEEPRLRRLATAIPRFSPGEPIPRVRLPGLAGAIFGFWSLWSVHSHGARQSRQRILTVFLHDDGRLLPSTARNIWALILAMPPVVSDYLDGASVTDGLSRLRGVWTGACCLRPAKKDFMAKAA